MKANIFNKNLQRTFQNLQKFNRLKKNKKDSSTGDVDITKFNEYFSYKRKNLATKFLSGQAKKFFAFNQFFF